MSTNRKNKFYAVIHAENESQVFRNVNVAALHGADGVFLINHSITALKLLKLLENVRRVMLPSFFVGVNILGMDAREAAKLLCCEVPDASGIWFDDIGYHERTAHIRDNLVVPKTVKDILKCRMPQCETFGPIDFKGQTGARDLAHATQALAPYVSVITTSGPATGIPPSVEKIVTMRQAIPTGRLAIASGMTPENVELYLDHVDCFLVATGVSNSFTELNAQRVKLMADKMRR